MNRPWPLDPSPGDSHGWFPKAQPLAEVQEAEPPKGPWGGFQGKALTVFLQTMAGLALSNTLARVRGTCYWTCSISDGDGCIAQLVEQLTLNQRAVGSSPTAPTILFKGLAATISPCVS